MCSGDVTALPRLTVLLLLLLRLPPLLRHACDRVLRRGGRVLRRDPVNAIQQVGTLARRLGELREDLVRVRVRG